jgi:acetyl-CoA carboxylase carboxyl transferase subunit beta
MKEIFRRHPRAAEQFEKSADNLWVRCPRCRELLYSRELEQSLWVCSKCKYHYPIAARQRIDITVDADSFEELDPRMSSVDPLHFQSLGETYAEKLQQYRDRADADEAFIYGTAGIDGQQVAIGASEFQFSGGSMGAVCGEKVTRAIELAIERQIPLILFSTGGGARMQEGTISLLQMAKTIAALDRLKDRVLPFFSVMTDPCLGGITASYAMLGDVNIAEPGAYIGFAGRRVIEQTMRQKLPANAATSEFLLKHGMLDLVTQRSEIPGILARLLKLYFTGTRIDAKREAEPQYA